MGSALSLAIAIRAVNNIFIFTEVEIDFLLLKKRKMEKSNMANNAPYPTMGQTNLDSASAPPSYEQSQFQENPASPNHMKSPFNPNVDGAGDLRQRQVPPQQQVVVQYVQPPQFGPRQMQVQCPHCQSMVLTRIEQDTSDKAWLFGFLICLLGGLCLSCIPCCMDSMQDTKHFCPACKNMIGQHKA